MSRNNNEEIKIQNNDIFIFNENYKIKTNNIYKLFYNKIFISVSLLDDFNEKEYKYILILEYDETTTNNTLKNNGETILDSLERIINRESANAKRYEYLQYLNYLKSNQEKKQKKIGELMNYEQFLIFVKEQKETQKKAADEEAQKIIEEKEKTQKLVNNKIIELQSKEEDAKRKVKEEDAKRKAKEDALRIAQEDALRIVQEDTIRIAQEEARRIAEEEEDARIEDVLKRYRNKKKM